MNGHCYIHKVRSLTMLFTMKTSGHGYVTTMYRWLCYNYAQIMYSEKEKVIRNLQGLGQISFFNSFTRPFNNGPVWMCNLVNSGIL
jgi:hypothetical protein